MIDERNNFIHPTAIIGANVEIGSNNYFGPYCLIGEAPEHRDHFQTKGRVVIGSDNIFTGMLTIDSSTNPDTPTTIGNKCFLMKQTHVGHDAQLGNFVYISPGARVGGHAEIADLCNLGMNSSIHQWVQVPVGCMIGQGSAVIKSSKLLEYGVYAGTPVKWIRPNVKVKLNQ